MSRGACRGELAPLVELAIVGEIALRDDAHHPLAVHHDRAVEELPLEPERCSHRQHG
jgi:hypothetical protein